MEAWPDFLDEIAGGDACVGDARILQATLLVTPDVGSRDASDPCLGLSGRNLWERRLGQRDAPPRAYRPNAGL
jgi:hypothetical protein